MHPGLGTDHPRPSKTSVQSRRLTAPGPAQARHHLAGYFFKISSSRGPILFSETGSIRSYPARPGSGLLGGPKPAFCEIFGMVSTAADSPGASKLFWRISRNTRRIDVRVPA